MQLKMRQHVRLRVWRLTPRLQQQPFTYLRHAGAACTSALECPYAMGGVKLNVQWNKEIQGRDSVLKSSNCVARITNLEP